MKTCVIIPAYNESLVIAGIVKQIRAKGLDALVIDDGSQDDTAKIAQNAGAQVLKNISNQGKGASLRQGFEYAISHNYENIITMDGDGQHDPDDIDAFMKQAGVSNNAMILGNRMTQAEGMPLIRWLTNKFTSRIISWMCRQEIADSQSGFRLIKTAVLKNIRLCTSKYEIESELILRIARLGHKITSIPIKTRYQNEKSQINPVVDTFRFITFVGKELWTTKS